MKGTELMKRILSLSVAVMLLFTSISFAAPKYTDNVAELLSELSIMQGDPDGNMRYYDLVSRAECAKIAVSASSFRDAVAPGSKTSPFKDVSYKHWAAPYVSVAVRNGLCKGYLDATFRPSNTVLYEEAATMFLQVLGYTSADFGSSWPNGPIGIAKNIGLLDNIDKKAGDTLTRRDIATMVYNTLISKQKGSQGVYLSTFNRSIVDDVVLISTIDEDPSIADGKVFTSSGTYNVADSLNRENIGKRGSMVLRNGDTVVAFIPEGVDAGADKHMVYSVLGNGIVTYKDGKFNQLDINSDTVFYKDSNKTSATSALSSLEMGDVLRVNYKSNGEIDYIMCTKGSTVGPKTVASQGWYASFGADSSVTVMRDGVKSSVSAVQTNDIAYYLKELDVALVYSKKVTGVYESASPNKDAPTSVTVSGVTYKLEGVNAFSKLSSSGTFNYGDTVTLLLGKSGDVADVATDSSVSSKVYGFLSAVGTKETEVNGTKVTKPYIKVILPTGEACEYITDKNYSTTLNSVISVTLKDGIASVTKVSSANSYYGKFQWNSGKNTLGSHTVADDVKILEVSSTNAYQTAIYATVYPQRLNGLVLDEKDVLYVSTNSAGHIDALITRDITGDMHTYGILTAASTGNGMSVSGSYEYISNGVKSNISTNNSAFNVTAGQVVKISTDGRSVTAISPLNKVPSTKVTDISGSAITIGNKKYTLSDKVQIYVKDPTSKTAYNMITRGEFEQIAYDETVAVYVDNISSTGGRVRIIIVS